MPIATVSRRLSRTTPALLLVLALLIGAGAAPLPSGDSNDPAPENRVGPRAEQADAFERAMRRLTSPLATLAKDYEATAHTPAPVATTLFGPRRRHHDDGLFGVPFSAAFVPVITATMTDALLVDNDSDGMADPGDTIRYTVVIANTGDMDATNVQFTDDVDPNTALVAGSENVSPLALDDQYSGTAGGTLVVPDGPGDLFDNDLEFLGDTFSLDSFDATSAQGGAVTVGADGSFSYTAPAVPSGPDTFTYTIVDGGGLTSTATVTITFDDPPQVTTTTPADSDTDVAVDATITIAFDEAVTPSGASAFTINCGAGNLTFTAAPMLPSSATSFVLTPDADLPGGTTCTVTAVADEIEDTDTEDPPNNLDGDGDGNDEGSPTDDFAFSFTTEPAAIDDGYTSTGNVGIEINAVGGVLANDDGANSVSQVQGAAGNVGTRTATDATGLGGVTGFVTMQTDGSFLYEPPPGFTGDDTFSYEVSLAPPGAAGKVQATTATVTITVSAMAWFIDGGAGASTNTGTFQNPFTSIGAFNTANAGGGARPDPQDGDVVYLYEGTYAEGLALRDSQLLYGDAVDLTGVFTADADSPSEYDDGADGTKPDAVNVAADAAPVIDFTPAAAPKAGAAAGAGDGITLGQDNTVQGIDLGDTPLGFGLVDDGTTIGTLTLSDVAITGDGGAFRFANGGDVANVTFDDVSAANAPAQGIHLVGITGTMTITASTSGITAPTDEAALVSGGTVGFTFPGDVTKTNTGTAIDILGGHATGTITFETGAVTVMNGDGLQFDNADGTYNFNGTTTLNGDDAGIDILGNSNGTFTFSSLTSITNPSGDAFHVTGDGANNPSITYSGTITNNAGDAIEVNNTAAGANTITFNSAAADAIQDSGAGLFLSGVAQTVNLTADAELSGSEGIDIDGGSGTFTFADTDITDPTGAAFDLTGGTASVNFQTNSSIAQTANNQTAVNVTGGHVTGTLDFDGTINATNGDGLQFDNADGTYDFSSAVALSGGDAGIDILGNSNGTFTFSANTVILNPAGDAFHVTGDGANNPSITYSGAIGNTAGDAIEINNTAAGANTITFDAPLLGIADTGTGIFLSGVGQTVTVTANAALTGSEGIDIDGGSGTFTFADTDITDPTGTALDVNGGTASVNFQTGSSIAQTANNQTAVNVTGGHVTGTLDFDGTINAMNGDGLQFDNADGTYDFSGAVTLGGGDAGIDILNDSAGTFTFSNTTITTPTNEGLNVDGSDATVTYTGGSITQNNADEAVRVNDHGGGSITIGASVSASTTTANAINLIGTNAGTITFQGGLGLTTTTGTAFNATGGGTVNVCADDNCSAGGGTPVVNTVNTTSTAAAGVNIVSTTIGTDGVTFESIDVDGATNGIVLNTTGSGAFEVAGDGPSDPSTTAAGRTTAKQGGGTITLGSGGTLTNVTDAVLVTSAANVTLRNMVLGDATAMQNDPVTGTSVISDNGIELNGVTNFTLDNVLLSRTADHGIQGFGSNAGLTLLHTEILNTGDNGAGPTDGDDAMDFKTGIGGPAGPHSLTGTVTIQSSILAGMSDTGMEVENFSGDLDLTVLHSFIGNNHHSDAACNPCEGDGFLLRADGGNATIDMVVQNTTFNNVANDGIDIGNDQASNTSTLLVEDISGTNNSNADNLIDTANTSGTITVRITDVTSDVNHRGSVLFFKADGAATTDITINTSGATANQILGSSIGNGLEFFIDGDPGSGSQDGNARILVDNTDMSNVFGSGVFMTVQDMATAGGFLDATLNDISTTQPTRNDNVIQGSVEAVAGGGGNGTLQLNLKNSTIGIGSVFFGSPTEGLVLRGDRNIDVACNDDGNGGNGTPCTNIGSMTSDDGLIASIMNENGNQIVGGAPFAAGDVFTSAALRNGAGTVLIIDPGDVTAPTTIPAPMAKATTDPASPLLLWEEQQHASRQQVRDQVDDSLSGTWVEGVNAFRRVRTVRLAALPSRALHSEPFALRGTTELPVDQATTVLADDAPPDVVEERPLAALPLEALAALNEAPPPDLTVEEDVGIDPRRSLAPPVAQRRPARRQAIAQTRQPAPTQSALSDPAFRKALTRFVDEPEAEPALIASSDNDVHALGRLLSRSDAMRIARIGGGLERRQDVDISLGTLPPGTSVTITFDATVGDPLPAGVDAVCNQGTVTADDPASTLTDDPDVGGGTDPTCTPVEAEPILTLDKDDGDVTVMPGGTIAYTLTYENTGNQDATGVTLSETVPANTTFNAGASTPGWVCVPNGTAGSTCTLSVGALAAGAGTSMATFAVDVDNPVPAGVDLITNDAAITDDGANSAAPSTDTAQDTTPIDAMPEVIAEKTDTFLDDGNADGVPNPGETIRYTITITNGGDEDGTGVVFTDRATDHPNTTLVVGSVTTTLGTITTGNTAGDTDVAVAVGALPGGGGAVTITFDVTVEGPLPAGVDEVCNQGTVSDNFPDVPTDDPDDATGMSDPTCLAVTATPDLTLTKDDGGQTAQPGDGIAYALTYENVGTQDATGVVLTETVPMGATFNAGAGTAGWVCAPDGNPGATCTLSVGAVAAGAGAATATFAVTVANPIPAGTTQIDNTASIADDGTNGPDPTPADNTAGDATPLDAAPDMALSKDDGGAQAVPGGGIAYTLTYTNNGNEGATGVVLTETVPAHTTFDAGASTPGWVCTPDGMAGATCTLAVGALAGGGASAQALFAVTVDASVPESVTEITNTASVADDSGDDPNLADNTDTDTTPLDATPEIVVAKMDAVLLDIVGSPGADPGDRIQYTITITNAGGREALGVVFSDTVDPNTALDCATITTTQGTLAGCAPGLGGALTVDVGSLVGNGGTVTIRVEAAVVAPFPKDVFEVANQGHVSGDNFADVETDDPDTAASADATVTAINAADVALTKTLIAFTGGGDDEARTFEATFLLTATNNGPSDASGVFVRDPLPGGAALVSQSGGYDAGAGLWTVGALASGASATLTLTLKAEDDNDLVNIAEVFADQPDRDCDNNLAGSQAQHDVVNPARFRADLSLTKTVDDPSPEAGALVTYTLAVANAGPSTTAGVRVREVVPEGLAFVSAEASNAATCPTCGYNDSLGVWIVGHVPVGQTVRLTLAARVVGTGRITNTAEIIESHLPDVDSILGNGDAGEDDQASATIEVASGKATATVSTGGEGIPGDYELGGNYPNPFNPETVIPFGVPAASHVVIEVYDLLGKRVGVLLDEALSAGRHEVVWYAVDEPSGVYLVRLVAGTVQKVQRVTLVK